MQHHRTFACAAALLIALCSRSFAQPCSQATVRGTWGFQGRGMAMVSLPGVATAQSVPFVALGTLKVDYQGRYTAHGTASAGGQIQEADWSGSIEVNPDCTATDTYNYGSIPSADRFVILDNGTQMRALPTKFYAGPVAATYSFRRISWGEPRCTSRMVRGVYGGSSEGDYMFPVAGQPQPVLTPFTAISSMTLSPDGSGTIATTASRAGSVADVQWPDVSMTVNPDCTAILKRTMQYSGQTVAGTVKYIVLNHGDELIGMETENSTGLPIKLESHKRISMFPVGPDR